MSAATPATWVEIDLAALEHNLGVVTRLAGERKVIGAIKANGYGCGAVGIARALEHAGVHGLWTGNVEEAVAARQAGVTTKIIMFGGPLPEQFDHLVGHDLIPTVYDRAGVTAAAEVASRRGRVVPVYLKVDCGLRRLGVQLAEARALARAIDVEPGLHLEGIYTHLPFGDEDGRNWAHRESAAFTELLDALTLEGIRPEITQIWGSSGLLSGLPDSTNAVCVGQLLYGLTPLPEAVASSARFAPVIAGLKARMIHIGNHPVGPEGSSNPYMFGRAERTGVIALGTAEGMRGPAAGRQMHVLVRGRRAPIIGTSLEHVVVDLDGIDDAVLGDEVVLIGHSGAQTVSLQDWAAWFGCSPLEVAVTLLGRIAKRYKGAQD
ncbi:alanine racemase [Mycolicibacterium goodii]|uniref:alanine racemase n=1 Tax=Mycolicibacterium goodii TaxID=134601 RepID=UPI001BDD4145|nr:alanine racemase [Mycolicibacterium goodii]MBU8817580.1 alanine racemase [Mycolicibacterium goodii]